MAKANPDKIWRSLKLAEKWKVLHKLLKRLRAGKRLPGTTGVGIGYRTLTSAENRRKFSHTAGVRRNQKNPRVLIKSHRHPRVLTSDLCIRFYVKEKLPHPRRPIPGFIATVVTVKGRRRLCHVPTDVAVHHGGKPQGYFEASGSVGSVRGAGCCIVSQADSPKVQYLLGCHHVLTLSMINGNQPASLPISETVWQSGNVVASTADWSDLTPASGNGFDAALARTDAGAVWPPDWLSHQPSNIMSSAMPPKQVTIHTPRGDIDADFVDYQPSVDLDYEGQTLTIGPVFQFTAATQEGDSGSAVSDGSTLCAMHFYGNPGAQSALGLPADAIFKRGRFHVAIILPP
jgi:hypothetical protein